MITKKQERCKRVIARLETQLSSGVKTQKKTTLSIPLEEKDIKRINIEIKTLKARV
jgi:hypothetical protein